MVKLCNNCPSNPNCTSCLGLIEGGTLRRKVNPLVPVVLYNSEAEEDYSGNLVAISRVGMLIETNAPKDNYIVYINDKIKAHLSPIYHKGVEDMIAFDILKVTRDLDSENKLSKDEYEYLFMDKKKVIDNLTENLQEDIKTKLREELKNELVKSEILDRLLIGSTFKYEKGCIKQLSGEKISYLKNKDMVRMMQNSLRENEPKRDTIIDTEHGRFIDIHSIPLGFQTGGFLTFDVTEVVNKEKQLLKEQWENYKDVIYSITHGKIVLKTIQEINEMATLFNKREIMDLTELNQLALMREEIKNELIKQNVPNLSHYGILLAVQEAATNALKHAKQGCFEIWNSERQLVFVIKDQGKGIQMKDLPKATLIHGYSTTSTLGQGFNLISRFSDEVHLKSDRSGTTVGLLFDKEKMKQAGG